MLDLADLVGGMWCYPGEVTSFISYQIENVLTKKTPEMVSVAGAVGKEATG